jgi:hypothetical protein
VEELFPWFQLSNSFDSKLLGEVPLLARARLLLSMVQELGEVKATARGYLPRKIVNAVFQVAPDSKYDLDFSQSSEEYAGRVHATRIALVECGWILFKNNRFSLREDGERIAKSGFSSDDYLKLVKYRLLNYNWAFEDRYPEIPLLQGSCLFLLYMLFKQGRREFSPKEFAQIYLRAFPDILSQIPERSHRVYTPEEELEKMLAVRFLERFAWYCGLVERRLDESLPYLEQKESERYWVSDLFCSAVKFQIGLESNIQAQMKIPPGSRLH